MDDIKVTSLFDGIPRMGHSDDLIQTLISFLSSNNSDDDHLTTATDYVIGLTFIAFVVIIITVLWLLVVTIMSCSCCCNIGFLSGHRFREHSRRATPIRIVFILFVFFWITATVLTVTKGIGHSYETLHTVENTLSKVSQFGTDSAGIFQNLTQSSVDAAELADKLVEILDTTFCPALLEATGSGSVQDELQEVTDIDLVTLKEDTVKALTKLSDFSRKMNFVKIQDAMTELSSSAESIDETIETVGTYVKEEYVQLFILIPGIIVPTFLLIGVVLALFVGSKKKLPRFWECSLEWIFFPVLVLQTILAAVLASAFSVLGVANHDFCSPSTFSVSANSTLDGPQFTLMSVAESLNLVETLLLILKFYVSDCQEVDPSTVNEMQEYLTNATKALNQLLEYIESADVDTIQNIIQSDCGDSNFRDLINWLTEMADFLNTLNGIISQALEVFSCKKLSPIINDTLDDGLCYHCINTLTWCVVCLSTIALFGLVMITFRSSFQLSATDAIFLGDDVNAMTVRNKNCNDDKDDDDDDDNERVNIYHPPNEKAADDDDVIVVPNVEKKKEEETPAQATSDDDEYDC